MPQLLVEPTTQLADAPLQEAAATPEQPAGVTYRARIIEGDRWGSSGYYAAEVLEAAAEANVFAAGTQMFLDHPGMAEAYDRPARSVRDLAGKLSSDAVYENGNLYADIEVYPHVAPLVEALAKDIGLSIRALCEVEQGEAQGRRGTIVREFDTAVSVDFVTKAGAGGAIVVESARANHRAIEHGVAEATVNDTREALAAALADAYGGPQIYVWVRDFDDSTVWFEVNDDADTDLYGQPYSQSDGGAIALSGERTEVRVQTTYVPVTPRPDSTTTTEESEEDTMPHIQIEEAEHRRLVEEAGRVTALVSERDQAVTERDEAVTRATTAEAALAESGRATAARRVIGEAATAAGVAFTPLEERGLMVDMPLSEDGTLDEAAFRTSVDTQAAAVAEAAGKGRPRGLGQLQDDPDVTQEAADEARRRRAGLTQIGA